MVGIPYEYSSAAAPGIVVGFMGGVLERVGVEPDRVVLGGCVVVVGVVLLVSPLWVTAFHLGAYPGVVSVVDGPPGNADVPVTDRAGLSAGEEAILSSLLADGEVVVYAPVEPDHPGIPPAYGGIVDDGERGGYVVDGDVTYEVVFGVAAPPTGLWVLTGPVGGIAGLSLIAAGYLYATARFGRRQAVYMLVFGLVLVGWVGSLGNLHGHVFPIR